MKIIRQRKFSRFGMIQTVWPDLAKFCHFGKNLFFWVPPYLNGFICTSILESQAHHLRFYQCKFDLCHVVKTTINKKMPGLPHSKKHLQIAERKPCPKPPFCCEGHCYYFLLSWLRDIVSTCALHTTVWPDSAHFCHFGEIWQFCKCFFSIWQHIRHTLAYLLCHWVNFHCFKWLNIRQTI